VLHFPEIGQGADLAAAVSIDGSPRPGLRRVRRMRGALLPGDPVAAAAVTPPMAATAAWPAAAMTIRERRMVGLLR